MQDSPSRRKPSPWTPPARLPATITTPRLVIRRLAPGEVERYTAVVRDNAGHLWPWLGSDISAVHGDAAPADGTELILALELRHDGQLVGACTLHSVDERAASAAVDVWIAADHTRRGLATEALRHLLSSVLTPQRDGGWGFNRVHLQTGGANVAARHVARRLGLRREQRRRQHRWVDGVGIDDTYGWGVLADEWDTDAMAMVRDERDHDVGVGPHPDPWPTDDRYDPVLLREGDRRNVADRYRWWHHEAIVADLAEHANPFHVAIENWRHDNNIGTVVRTANAFGAAGVHIVGRRNWNRRGAMVTDRYLTIHHHPDTDALVAWAAHERLPLIGIDNLPGSVSLFTNPPPERAVLVLGQEGPGLTPAARQAVDAILHIPQFGSTRSINAGVASGIAMAAWVRAHRADAD